MRRIVLVACLGIMGCVSGQDDLGSEESAYTPSGDSCTNGPKTEAWTGGKQQAPKPYSTDNVVLFVEDSKNPEILYAVGADVGANLVLFRYTMKRFERPLFTAWVQVYDWFDLVGGGRTPGVVGPPIGPGVHDSIFLARAQAVIKARHLDEGVCSPPNL
jgi:hypothetical protein